MGLKEISEKYKLLLINRHNFYKYYTLSCQMTGINDLDIMNQVQSICLFQRTKNKKMKVI